MSELILVEDLEPQITSVMLNHAARRNALSIALLEQLCEQIERKAAEQTCRVIILRGAGPVFSAGLDLREAADSQLVEQSARAVQKTLRLLQQTELIVIAAVQGGAFAGGAGVMAACDIVVAATDAKFSFPEARRGLLPALICDVLQHKIREGDLRELFLAGDLFDATRAQMIGLVQRIVSSERLLEESFSVARSVMAGGPDTIRETKRLLNAMYSQSGEQSGPDLITTHLAANQSAEAREGLAAFNEKREPNWS